MNPDLLLRLLEVMIETMGQQQFEYEVTVGGYMCKSCHVTLNTDRRHWSNTDPKHHKEGCSWRAVLELLNQWRAEEGSHD